MSDRSYHLQYSIDSDEIDDQSASAWCHQNWYRVLFVIILAALAIGTTSSLIYILYKDALKEKALAEKKKGWAQKWKIIQPYIKNFPMGFLLGFIRNLIVLAIERQSELQ